MGNHRDTKGTEVNLRAAPLRQRFALEFWMPLPLIGLIFWLGGGLVTEHILNQSSSPVLPLRQALQFNVQPAVNFLEIRADLDRSQNRTNVTAIQISEVNAYPKRVQFELATTEFDQVEVGIAQRLEIPTELVRRLVSYRMTSNSSSPLLNF